MITTLTGANDFARTQQLNKLVAAYETEYGSLGLERLDGEEATPERMAEALHSLPFLAPRKLVVLREPGKQKKFAESVADILAQVPDTTDVILVEPKLDKRLSYYKFLKKSTDFQDYAPLDPGGLATWATNYAKEQGGSLNSADARLLVDRVGGNQQMVQHEIDKLLAYDQHITATSIELLTERLPQSTIFELLEAALAGNAQRALGLYREQRALKVEPQAIIALLAWQLHVLAVVAAGNPRSADDIARTSKLNPFVVRKSQTAARRLGINGLKKKVSELLTLDMRLKRAAIDADEAVQLYLLRLSA